MKKLFLYSIFVLFLLSVNTIVYADKTVNENSFRYTDGVPVQNIEGAISLYSVNDSKGLKVIDVSTYSQRT